VTYSAADVLRTEAAALTAAADRLDEVQFKQAVDVVLSAQGKVHVLGTGTSGAIARKVAATLTSTGTPALFLHPGDALHGGLGIVTAGDVAIAVSNSGETAEILAVLPYLQSRDVPVVAIVGNPTSALARAAAAVLDARIDSEACPLGLAPTTSTTLALALGDALAVALMDSKGLTQEAFASNHPSGRLGRRLTLRVRDLMIDPADASGVSPAATFLEVVTAMGKGGLGAAPVLDGDTIVGLITDGDIRRIVTQTPGADLLGLSAATMMTASPVTVTADLLAYEALRTMEDRPSQISVLPVVDGAGALVGMLRLHDLVRAGL
jgi:arabinose-5-phosphate isomerase